MARTKVVTYVSADGREAMTGATQAQMVELREAGKLRGVRRVRQWRAAR